MSGCGEWAFWHAEHGFIPFKCGRPNCEREACRRLFYHRRVTLISDLVSEYNLTKFFTLTLDPELVKGDPWEYIHEPWAKLRKRINRLAVGWKYAAVLERHKYRDVPHIHGFTDVWLDQKVWSRHWYECGGGAVVWVSAVDNQGVTNYVTKQLRVCSYVGKDQLLGATKRSRIVRTLWRSKNTRSKKELTRVEGWCIIKDKVFLESGEISPVWANRRIRIGNQEEFTRQDLEATCLPLP